MIYIILLILTVHSVEQGDTTAVLDKQFNDRTDCEIAEGEILTAASQDPTVTGWVMPLECQPVEPAKKA